MTDQPTADATPTDWSVVAIAADGATRNIGPVSRARADEVAADLWNGGASDLVTVIVAAMEHPEGQRESYTLDTKDFNLVVSALGYCAADTAGRDPGVTKAEHTALFMGACHRLQAQLDGPAGERARARLKVAEAEAQVPR